MNDCLADPEYRLCRLAVRRLKRQGVRLYVTPQILIELRAVVTRPQAANGLGRTSEEATMLLRQVRRGFLLLEETPEVFARRMRLAKGNAIVGRQVYNTRLVAVMQVHGVDSILTFN